MPTTHFLPIEDPTKASKGLGRRTFGTAETALISEERYKIS
jgi:hypothetical protein